MTFEIVCPESVVESEIAAGLTQLDVAMTYALAMRKSDPGEVDWGRMNKAVRKKWGRTGLAQVKRWAHDYYSGRREFGT